MKTGEPIRIDELPIDGLEHLRQQLQTVLEAKKKGIEILANTAGAFDQSRSAIEDLSKLKDGKSIQLGCSMEAFDNCALSTSTVYKQSCI